MLNLVTKEHKDYNIFLKSSDNEQVFIVASVINKEANIVDLCNDIYNEITQILVENKIEIFHERIFGSICLCDEVGQIRKDIFEKHSIDSEVPFTFVDGSPIWGEGISGINIHGVVLKRESDRIWNVKHKNKVCGRVWRNKNSEQLILHSIHAPDNKDNAYNQTLEMFEEAECILRENDFCFRDVVRTWIYLHDILKQYDDFNKARNLKFREFKLLPNEIDDTSYEHIYMPASTGIGCSNPFKTAGVMDVYAVKKSENSSLVVHNENGNKQKSAYRYGSAFSRSLVMKDEISKYIYLSGTASIDEKGNTVYIDDIRSQLEMTRNVILGLAGKENFDFSNICEGTVFIKRTEFIQDYNEYCKRYNLDKSPVIVTIADVCRDNLLFEMDATLIGVDDKRI